MCAGDGVHLSWLSVVSVGVLQAFEAEGKGGKRRRRRGDGDGLWAWKKKKKEWKGGGLGLTRLVKGEREKKEREMKEGKKKERKKEGEKERNEKENEEGGVNGLWCWVRNKRGEEKKWASGLGFGDRKERKK